MEREKPYDPAAIEPKWQQRWEEQGLHRSDIDPSRPKHYALTMLPYPSGDLHIGHWYAMTPRDARARFMRMQRLQRDVPDGLRRLRPARRERRHQAQHPPQGVDLRQHRAHARAAARAWAPCSTGSARPSRPTRILPVDAVVLPPALQARPGLPARWPRWTGAPSCNTTLAREQVVGDDRRCERCGTPVIKQEPGAVVLPHHQLRRGAAGLQRDRLARARARPCRPTGSAAAKGADVDLPHRATSGETRSRSSPPGPTRCGARPSWCWRPSTRWSSELTTPDRKAEVEAYVVPGHPPDRDPARGRGQGEDRRLHRRAMPSIRSTASASRSGSPTTC